MGRRDLCLCLLWATASMGSGGTAATQTAACVRLDNRIAELRLKLRMGYTARQGRIYRQRLAALEAERRASCR